MCTTFPRRSESNGNRIWWCRKSNGCNTSLKKFAVTTFSYNKCLFTLMISPFQQTPKRQLRSPPRYFHDFSSLEFFTNSACFWWGLANIKARGSRVWTVTHKMDTLKKVTFLWVICVYNKTNETLREAKTWSNEIVPHGLDFIFWKMKWSCLRQTQMCNTFRRNP